MNTTTEELLEKTSIRKLALRWGIPAMFGQFFNLLYSIVDRNFAARIPGTGEMALAAIGVCAPAFAYMAGVGGASCMSISLGDKSSVKERKIFSETRF